jgi:hypothetical protein
LESAAIGFWVSETVHEAAQIRIANKTNGPRIPKSAISPPRRYARRKLNLGQSIVKVAKLEVTDFSAFLSALIANKRVACAGGCRADRVTHSGLIPPGRTINASPGRQCSVAHGRRALWPTNSASPKITPPSPNTRRSRSGTAALSRNTTEIGASPSRLSKSTWPQ